jgi:hypothetical protein
MTLADLIVLAIIGLILALASTKILVDRRRIRSAGGIAAPGCASCPLAVHCALPDSREKCAAGSAAEAKLHASPSCSCGS